MLKDATTAQLNPVKDARKQQLVNATMECIYHHGLAGTTVSKVTRAANLSGGIVNFYFQSKEKLLLGTLIAIRDEFEHEMLHSIRLEESPAVVLERVIDVHFNPAICRPDKIAVWHAFSSARRTREDYNKICGDLEAKLEELIRKQIARLSEHDISKQDNPALLARSLIGLLDSYWQDCLYSPSSFDRDQAVQQCLQFLRTLFPDSFPKVQKEPSGDTVQSSDVDLPGEDKCFTNILAPWTYLNQELFELEIDTLFKPSWMLAGHISELARPRDYITFDGFGERALIVKDNSGAVRAFHNVCRHRGARLLEGRGSNCPHALSCPFHGWTYDLAGNLIGIPAEKTFENLDPAENGLVPIEFEVWMGFIFVRFETGGPPLKQLLAPVEDLIAPYHIEEMHSLDGSRYREIRPYNWKIIHDIDNEGYHVPVGHPTLQQLYGKNYSDDYVENISVSKGFINEKPAKLWSVKQYQRLLPEFEHLPEDHQRLWLYIGIFPNLVIGLYPECIEFYMTIPKSLDSSWFMGCSYGLADDRREVKAARFLNRRINCITDREDDAFVRWMQEGMRSSAFPQQKLSSLEHGVRRFHQEVQRHLPVAKLNDAPAPGSTRAVNDSLFKFV